MLTRRLKEIDLSGDSQITENRTGEERIILSCFAQARKPHCQTEAWHTIENEYKGGGYDNGRCRKAFQAKQKLMNREEWGQTERRERE